MNRENSMTVNRLPAKTWYWLKMNDAKADRETDSYPDKNDLLSEKFHLDHFSREDRPEISAVTEKEAAVFKEIGTGMGADMDEFLKKVPACLFTGNKIMEKERPVVLDLASLPGENNFYKLYIDAQEGSRTDVVILNSGGEEVNGEARAENDKNDKTERFENGGVQEETSLSAIQIKIFARANAVVRLYMAQTLSAKKTSFWDIGGRLLEDARVEIVKLEAGAAKVYCGTSMDLDGKRSFFDARIGYLGKNKQHFDMNYVAVHKGKNTGSNMEISGVLDDRASKLFRGTIDFKPGCAGAKGDEKEEVLMLGDNVVNQTIPLILCSEEEVEGNHGASIGNLDEKTLFYLTSRGFSVEAAQQMIARARMDSLCDMIPDEGVQAKIQAFLDRH